MRKWRFYAIAAVVCAMFTRAAALPYVLAYLIVIPVLLAEWARKYAFRRVAVEREVWPRAVFCGESAEIRVRMTNRSLLPVPWITFMELVPSGLRSTGGGTASLASHETVRLSYPVVGARRGYYRLKTSRITAGDFFGLGEESRGLFNEGTLTVYPRVHPLPELGLPTRLPFGRRRTRDRIFEDPSRIIGLREYQPGDPQSRLHWKATARSSRLMVKEYQPSVSMQFGLFIELDPERYDLFNGHEEGETAIELAASLVVQLSKLGEGCAVFSNGRDSLQNGEEGALPGSGIREGRSQTEKALSTLARLEMAHGLPLTAIIAQHVTEFPWGATLLFIVKEDRPDLVLQCMNLARRGYKPVIFVLGAMPSHSGLARNRGIGGVMAFAVFREEGGHGFRFE